MTILQYGIKELKKTLNRIVPVMPLWEKARDVFIIESFQLCWQRPWVTWGVCQYANDLPRGSHTAQLEFDQFTIEEVTRFPRSQTRKFFLHRWPTSQFQNITLQVTLTSSIGIWNSLIMLTPYLEVKKSVLFQFLFNYICLIIYV